MKTYPNLIKNTWSNGAGLASAALFPWRWLSCWCPKPPWPPRPWWGSGSVNRFTAASLEEKQEIVVIIIDTFLWTDFSQNDKNTHKSTLFELLYLQVCHSGSYFIKYNWSNTNYSSKLHNAINWSTFLNYSMHLSLRCFSADIIEQLQMSLF